jgi:hypothetical protein
MIGKFGVRSSEFGVGNTANFRITANFLSLSLKSSEFEVRSGESRKTKSAFWSDLLFFVDPREKMKLLKAVFIL